MREAPGKKAENLLAQVHFVCIFKFISLLFSLRHLRQENKAQSNSSFLPNTKHKQDTATAVGKSAGPAITRPELLC